MNFGDKGLAVRTLQQQLQALGHGPTKADGDFGPATAAALASYALAAFKTAPVAATPARSLRRPNSATPPWLAVAEQELGQREVAGAQHNPRIVSYHQSTTYKATDDETPWCASFVCWCLEHAGVPSTQSARARDFTNWGQKLQPHEVGPGAIAVFWRGKSKASGKGHVGFYVGGDPAGPSVAILGGNQNDSVTVAPTSTQKLIGFYWPLGIALPTTASVQAAHALEAGDAKTVRWA